MNKTKDNFFSKIFKFIKEKTIKLVQSSSFRSFLASAICVVLGLLVGFIVILIVNAEHAPKAIGCILKGGFSAVKWKKGVGSVIVNATPLLLCSLSIIFAYKCGLFNIGAPGQYVIGILFSFIGAYILKAPWYVCVVMAAIGGAIWGVIPGIFKAFLNVNEVITSIMFNWIGLHLLNYVAGPELDVMYNKLLAECVVLPK